MSDVQVIPSNPRFQDLNGQTFGRLTVIEYAGRNKGSSLWLCKCACGELTQPISASDLKKGHTQSCGCFRVERTSAKNTTHGLAHTEEYRIWQCMKARCGNPKNADYPDYGGRGIKVCTRWKNSFSKFLCDMGKRPSSKYSIDRFPDCNGDYDPENCRWATGSEQARNRRNKLLITCEGQTKNIDDWSDISGIKYITIYQRIKRGIPAKEAIFSPVGSQIKRKTD
jgi:hypothetical protein